MTNASEHSSEKIDNDSSSINEKLTLLTLMSFLISGGRINQVKKIDCFSGAIYNMRDCCPTKFQFLLYNPYLRNLIKYGLTRL